MGDFERLFVLSVPFHNVSFDEAVAWASERMARNERGGVVVTPNLDFMYGVSRDAELRRVVYASDLVVADGMPAVWLSGLFGPRLKERVTGSDLTPRLLQVCAERGFGVYAIGGAPGVAEKALARMGERYPGLKVAGTYSPPMAPFEKMDLGEIGRRVREAAPHLVLVAMGMAKQERLMHWLREHTEVPLMMGVGGSLDFLAGVQTRAPRWVQRSGLEWVWRTGTDPGRFIKRYAADGLWLMKVLGRLCLARAAALLEGAGKAAAGEGEPEPGVLRLPELANAARQSAFLEEAAGRGWRRLDLRGRRWLNSLEMGAVAVLGGAEPLAGPGVARQLACVGVAAQGAAPRVGLAWLLFGVGALGVAALAAAAAGPFGSGVRRAAFAAGGLLLLGAACGRAWRAWARAGLPAEASVPEGGGSAARMAELYESLLNDEAGGGHPRLSWSSWILPGEPPGGDFVGCTFRGERQVDFVVGDVSGKNEAAVLLGAASKYEVLRVVSEAMTASPQRERPGVLSLARMAAAAIDRRIVKLGAYLTVGYARFDFEASALEYVWHGAPPFFHWRRATGEVEVVRGQGAAVGLQVRERVCAEARAFAPGDLFVFCSDGVLFSRDSAGGATGETRVAGAVARAAPGGVEAVLAEVRALCAERCGSGVPQDDMACLVACVAPVK